MVSLLVKELVESAILSRNLLILLISLGLYRVSLLFKECSHGS